MARNPHADDPIPEELTHDEFLDSLQEHADKLCKGVDAYLQGTSNISDKIIDDAKESVKVFYNSKTKLEMLRLNSTAPSKIKRSEYKDWDYRLNEEFKKMCDSSSKYQLSISAGTNDLLTSWANLEGRTSASVATEALLRGLSAMKRDGAIPKTALKQAEEKMQRRSIYKDIAQLLTEMFSLF